MSKLVAMEWSPKPKAANSNRSNFKRPFQPARVQPQPQPIPRSQSNQSNYPPANQQKPSGQLPSQLASPPKPQQFSPKKAPAFSPQKQSDIQKVGGSENLNEVTKSTFRPEQHPPSNLTSQQSLTKDIPKQNKSIYFDVAAGRGNFDDDYPTSDYANYNGGQRNARQQRNSRQNKITASTDNLLTLDAQNSFVSKTLSFDPLPVSNLSSNENHTNNKVQNEQMAQFQQNKSKQGNYNRNNYNRNNKRNNNYQGQAQNQRNNNDNNEVSTNGYNRNNANRNYGNNKNNSGYNRYNNNSNNNNRDQLTRSFSYQPNNSLNQPKGQNDGLKVLNWEPKSPKANNNNSNN
ncbi:hypothetical protein TRFO_28615 [Tritrichomonas foetus]|uniref:Uncharacterized protein n=1 Tax=Tritrichomonas foetus TaxID=1144522 RepID=A0A1J4JY94_9EUKA|nr:hypothetical protein TRFO_28615 [Tritrichomonas foetus]|eukprot:OHT03963.1 hypothetical protein TRFO_28615 [Tritrichomonas foetus]